MTLEAFIPDADASVACGSCRLCCRKTLVILLPEHGDKISSYQTQIINGHVALAMKPNGDCVYLEDDGCSIHGRHPVMCRKYDCAAHYRSLTRPQRREAVRKGWLSNEVIASGRERAQQANTEKAT